LSGGKLRSERKKLPQKKSAETLPRMASVAAAVTLAERRRGSGMAFKMTAYGEREE